MPTKVYFVGSLLFFSPLKHIAVYLDYFFPEILITVIKPPLLVLSEDVC